MEEKLQEIFRNVFDDESILLTRKLCADDIESWDSLTYFELIMETEHAFEIKLTAAEITGIKSAGQLMDIICRHLGE